MNGTIKAAIFAVSGTMTALPAVAQDATETCSLMSEVAGDLMFYRQEGHPVSIYIDELDGALPDELILDIFSIAQRVPQFNTDLEKGRAVIKFQRDMELVCLRNFEE